MHGRPPSPSTVFSDSARYYDLLYRGKDYAEEAECGSIFLFHVSRFSMSGILFVALRFTLSRLTPHGFYPSRLRGSNCFRVIRVLSGSIFSFFF